MDWVSFKIRSPRGFEAVAFVGLLLIGIGWTCLLTGCQTAAESNGGNDLSRLTHQTHQSDQQSQDEPLLVVEDLRDRPLVQVNPIQSPDEGLHRPESLDVQFYISTADMPLDESTDAAWAVGQPAFFSEAGRQLWQANGMNAVVVSQSQLAQVQSLFPVALSAGERYVRTRGDWEVLVERPVNHRVSKPSLDGASDQPVLPQAGESKASALPVTLRLNQEGTLPSQTHIDTGTMRLLVQARPDGEQGLLVEIWVQKHVPNRYGLVRAEDGGLRQMTLREKFEAGWFFDELTTTVRVPKGSALLIGLHRPWPDLPQGVPTEGGWPRAVMGLGVVCAAAYAQHYEPPRRAFARVVVPPLQVNLGQHFFTGQLRREPVQRVFAIMPAR